MINVRAVFFLPAVTFLLMSANINAQNVSNYTGTAEMNRMDFGMELYIK